MGVMNEDRLTLYDGLIKTHITNTTVAKETGKGLSTNDYTTTEKNKLAGVADGANKTIVDPALDASSENPVQNKVIAGEINTLKKSVSDGKTLVATAITDKGVNTAADATFAVMAENIGQIETGGGELHGATISVSTSEENPTTITVTLTKDSTTIGQKNFDSNGTCTFTDIQESGDYTITASDGTDSNSTTATVTGDNIVNKTVISVTIEFTLDGSTATPLNDVSIWLRTDSTGSSSNAGHTTLAEVIADTTTLNNLMGDKSAMQYLARSTGFADEGCASETFMTYLGASPHVDSTVLNSDLWYQKIYNSDYADIVIKFKIMTAIIDLSDSNPETCVTYADDAIGMTAGDSAWDEFFGHYPVLLKNGVEVGRLNRNNFNQFEDGTNADITSGDAGDVMIAFPRRGLTITTLDNKIYISMTDNPRKSSFEYNAHTRGTTSKDVFYIGVYKGYVTNSKLRSLSGKTITAGQTIGTFRTHAQANGDGYEQSGFYQLTFRQCMYIMKYKNLNSQTAVGYGVSNNTSYLTTGGTESWGMDCELIKETNPSYMTDQKHHVKCFGIEDFWGNQWEWIDGLVSDSSRNVLTANSGFNDSGSGYTNNGNGGVSANIGTYMSKPQGSTKAGFVVKEVNGSGSTYFCDYAILYASKVASFGGDRDYTTADGIFRLDLGSDYSYSNYTRASRLMYL